MYFFGIYPIIILNPNQVKSTELLEFLLRNISKTIIFGTILY